MSSRMPLTAFTTNASQSTGKNRPIGASAIFGAKPRIRRSIAMPPPARTPMPIVCSVRIAGNTKIVGVSRMEVLNAPFSMKARNESMQSRLSSVLASNTIALSRPGELLQHGFFKRQRLLHARAALHALEMRGAVPKACGIHIELRAAPHAPEEVRVRGGEVIEEVFPPVQQVVSDPVVLEQHLLRQPSHAVVGA